MRLIHRPAYRNSYIVATCVAIIVGIWLGSHGVATTPWLILLIGGWALALWRSAIWCIGLIAIGCSIGILRADQYTAELHRLTSQIGHLVTVDGSVITDPVTDAKHTTTVRLSSLSINGTPMVGIIKLTGRNLRVQRTFKVRATGILRPGFATWDGAIAYPKLTVLSDKLPPLEQLRQRFFGGMRTAVPDPEAAFGLGLLVGVGALIPKPLQLELTRVGLSHLTAVSGYNLTIIIRLMIRLLGDWGRMWS